ILVPTLRVRGRPLPGRAPGRRGASRTDVPARSVGTRVAGVWGRGAPRRHVSFGGRMLLATTTLYTFGDSILDCGHYNAHGVTPGGLLVRNDDRLFPEFRGRDLATR